MPSGETLPDGICIQEERMVLDIIKQAVCIKMTCKNPSPIISEAEFCYACAYALREMGREDLLEQVGKAKRVEELQKQILPVLEENQEACEENPPVKRLLHLLISSRVQGEITEEIRSLFQ